MSAPAPTSPSGPSWSDRVFPVLFGLFLGLCVLKFGNPVILDHRIDPPTDLAGWISQPWPIRWSFPLLLISAVSALAFGRPYSRFREARVPGLLILLPVLWLGWQFLASTGSVDTALSEVTLRQLSACVACFAVGFICLSPGLRRSLLWIGLLLGFLFCLNRAAQQRLFEFRQDYEALVEGQSNGWTNFNPAVLDQMRRDQLLVTTNGVEVANPAILDKMRRARVSGTLVYPNALAGMVLLLLPATLAVLAGATTGMKGSVRRLVLGCAAALGSSVLFWTGSKAGWLVALAVGAVWVVLQPLPRRLRFLLVAGGLVLGLTVFGLRFSGYFAKGATSAAARVDYWKAAVQNTRDRPVFGSGPGTFQRPYARLKPPEAEMARLVHNDFLEQATDSGVPGFLLYGAWVVWGLWFLGRRHAVVSASRESGTPGLPVETAVFLGLLAWFLHGMAEFGLYIPASAWTAFTLFGALLGESPRPAVVASPAPSGR